MNNSFFVCFFSGVLKKIKCWFENSIYFKIWMKIMGFFGKCLSNSFSDFIFCKERKRKFVENSFFNKLINYFVVFFDWLIGKPCRFIKKGISQSTLCNKIKFLLNNWQYISVRYFSVFIFSFGFISIAMEFSSLGFISNRWFLITAVGLIGCLFKSSFSQFCSGEFIFSKLKIKIFDNPHLIETKAHNSIAVAVVGGAVFGAMGFIPYLQLAVLAVCVFAFLIYKPFLISLFAVIMLPFLPTMVLVALMLMGVFVSFILYFVKHRTKIRIDGLDLAVMGLIFMNIYGVLISEAPVASAKIAAVYISFIAFFFVLRRYLANIKRFFITIDLFIVSATVVAGYGIIEQLFGLSQTTWQDEEMFEEIAGRACSTFENPNVLGEFLLLTIPITIARIFYSKKLSVKFAFSISGLMQALCMVYTYSRGCWLGIMFSIAIFLAFCGKKILTFMSVGIFALPFVIPQSIIDRLLSIGNTADTSTAYRVFIWEGTCRMLEDTWLFGIGLGSQAFNSVYPRYALGAITAPHPHNLYLLILSETGLIGALLVGIALLCYFRTTGRICRASEKFRVIGVSLACAMGGFLLQGMFDNVWYNYRIYALFVIMFAFVGALRDITEVSKND